MIGSCEDDSKLSKNLIKLFEESKCLMCRNVNNVNYLLI